jgi:hypothetical protein
MRPFTDIVAPFLGKPSWQVLWDDQTNLDLNFGAARLLIREPKQSDSPHPKVRALAARRQVTLRGEYWLWIYLARWKIVLRDGRAATGASSARQRNIVCANLTGEKVIRIDVAPGNGATTFAFDLGAVLHVRRLSPTEPEDMWLLYFPNGYILAVRGDGHYSYHRATAREAQVRWKPV